MFRLCEIIVVLVVASLWQAKGQPGTVREGDYDVLRNTSGGPIICAMDQPHQVRSDARSRLDCSKTCLQNDQCSSFNYKDTVSASGPDYTTYTCEHFNGYPFNFTVDPTCRHYAVKGARPSACYGSGVEEGMAQYDLKRVSSENCGYPFTYLGVLYHGCAKNIDGVTSPCERWGCFQVNYSAAVCAANIDFKEDNLTITLAIPTQGSISVISISNWIFFMHRDMSNGFNWNLTWNDYKNGFGLSSWDFWMGLERLHILTTSGSYRLRMEWQEELTGYWLSVEYWFFYIEDEASYYKLHVSGYIPGDDGRALVAGAAYNIFEYIHPSVMLPHNGMEFSTPTVDNDELATLNCAEFIGGGWWYNKCGVFAPTITTPVPNWYSPPDAIWYKMINMHLMVKLQ